MTRVLRDGRTWVAIVAIVAAVLLLQGPLGRFLAPTPTFAPSEAIDCGEEGGGGRGLENIAGRECLWAAYQQHRPAEFRRTLWTVEGDPIVYAYRVRGDGLVDVIADTRRDQYGPQGITFLECQELVRVDDPLNPDPLNFGPGEACVERQG